MPCADLDISFLYFCMLPLHIFLHRVTKNQTVRCCAWEHFLLCGLCIWHWMYYWTANSKSDAFTHTHTHTLSQPSCLHQLCFSFFLFFYLSELCSCPYVCVEEYIHFCSVHLCILEQIHSDPNTQVYTMTIWYKILESIHSICKKDFHLIYIWREGKERHSVPLP